VPVIKRIARFAGRLDSKVIEYTACLCDQNSDVFELRVNLYGCHAIILRFRCLVQIRCGPLLSGVVRCALMR